MTINPITDPALDPLPHGFFSRNGGLSGGIYASLNCGAGSRDDAQAVAQNRQIVAAAVGVQNLAFVHQTHSADVVIAGKDHKPGQQADAMVSATPGLGLAILTADCQPVLFADAQSGVIGAAHAGWRGALDGVLENTVQAMCDLGAQRSQIRAVIGPCISQTVYEVGPEFLDRFMDEDPQYGQFFTQGNADRYLFNLPSFGLMRLRAAGVNAAWVRRCTYSESDNFFSYRRSVHQNEPDYGRLVSVIALPAH